MKIIWSITGAGHLLKESIDVLDKLSYNHIITIAYSHAAQEVIKLYGYENKISQIISRNPENTIIKEEDQQYSYPFSGKITHEKYDYVILSPATANTVAKIVNGIADNLITNIIAQSGKGQIPCIIIPVDQKEGLIETILPPYINKDRCIICNKCINSCSFNALNPPHIDTLKCTCCKKCIKVCEYNAIIIGKKIEIYIRKIDADNSQRLNTIENIKTMNHPYNITPYLIKKSKE